MKLRFALGMSEKGRGGEERGDAMLLGTFLKTCIRVDLPEEVST